MESPERNPHTSDCEPQGSPTFSFLCTLSPIKPVKSARLAQTYSEINFPSAVSYNAPKLEQEDSASLTRDHCRNTPRTTQSTKLKQITFSGGLKSPKRDNKIYEHEGKSSKTPVNLSSISNKGNHECNELDNSENLVAVDTVTEDVVSSTACCRSEIDTGSMGKDIVLEHSRVLCNTICLSSANSGDCKKLLDFSREVSELEFMMFGECDKHSQQMCVTENEAQVLSPTLLGLSIEEVEEYIASLKEVVKEEQEKKETGCSSELISNSDGENNKFGDALVDEDNQNPSTAVRVSGPLQRGVRRRCLDFDVKTESDMVSLSNTSQDPMLSYAEKPDTSVPISKERTATRVVGSSVVVPCGIGLHLNSLTRSISFPQARQSNGRGCSSSPLTKRENVMQELGLSEFNRNNGSNEGSGEEFQQASRIDFVEEAKIGNYDREPECSDQIVDSSKSITCSRSGVKQLQDDQSSGLGKRPCPLGRKRVSLPGLLKDVEAPEDQSIQTPPSPLRKKRKTSSTSEKSGDGCKRCTCKKSKCLKLYCECFAAGVYCGDSCSCQGCFNKPEYEKTVMEAREVIESRNPLAFAPKIVRTTTEASPIINKLQQKEGGHGTPSHAGRHKRGCNCKRSHCLKKYCECYQAGVACTDACRCECCENTFGKKSGPEGIEEKEIQLDVLLDETVADRIDASDLCDQNNGPSRQQMNSISPLTPSFNYTGQNRSTVHSRSASKRCLASSEEQMLSPLGSLSSTIISRSPSRILRSCSKGAQRGSPCVNPTVTTPQGKSPISTPRILRIGNRWDDICTITPLPKAPSRPTTGASISIIDGIESSSINGRCQHYLPDCKTPAESHEQNVPTTPVFSSPVSRVDMNSCFRSEPGVDHQLLDWIEDDHDGENNSCTPEFLRDTEVGVLPVCLLNSSSPKHKRVSPPHFQDIRDQQTHAMMNHRGRSSNNCIRSGRKFILQSVPTLLPITPYPVDQTPVIHAECRDDEAP